MQAATLQGVLAIVIWASLAALTTFAGAVPPFQMAAMTFAVGTLVGVAYAYATGDQLLPVLRTVPAGAWALGVYGLLLFHVFYFYALQNAPVIEVNLISYLWPLLIVLMSGLLPKRFGGQGLRWWHVLGAAIAFAGTVLIILGASGRPEFNGRLSGYLAGFGAALVWSSYSVASRLYRAVPSSAVTGSCAVTAVGAALLHIVLETTVWPVNQTAWLAVLGLGLGPVGLAFYVWDRGMKQGNMQLLGAVSYATPLISTLIMAGLGLGATTGTIWISALLITAGALVAASDTLVRR